METILLVHGAWHTERCWDGVRKLLEKRSYRVKTFTLAGNSPEGKKKVSYDDIVQSLVDAIAKEEKVILVGHSSAGHVIQVAAPKAKDKIVKIIFNNAWILPDGSSQFDLVDPAVAGGMRAVAASRKDATIPMDEGFLRSALANDAPKEVQDALLRALVPQPLALLDTKVRTKAFAEAGFKVALLYCKDDVSVPPKVYLNLYKALGADKPVVEIPGAHETLFTKPETFVDGLEKCLV